MLFEKALNLFKFKQQKFVFFEQEDSLKNNKSLIR